jgi:hypothetical protein
MIVGTATALLCVNTTVLVGPVARALDGADLSSLVGPVVGASLYVVLTVRSRRALRAVGADADAGSVAGAAEPVGTVLGVE